MRKKKLLLFRSERCTCIKVLEWTQICTLYVLSACSKTKDVYVDIYDKTSRKREGRTARRKYKRKRKQNKNVYDILAKQAQAGKPSVWRPIFKFNLGGTKASPLYLSPTLPPRHKRNPPSMFACFAIHSYLLFYTSEQNI